MRADTFAGRVLLALRRDPPEEPTVDGPPAGFLGRLLLALRGTDVFAEPKPSQEDTVPPDRDAETIPTMPARIGGRETPRYVVRDSAEADAVLLRLVRDGWLAREGFFLPDPAWDVSGYRLVLHGRVADTDDIQLAVLAAARGAGIVAVVEPAAPFRQSLIDDLRLLGAVHEELDPPVDASGPVDMLVPEQRALLQRLAAGDTVAAAAAAEFLSLRTANRRIAEARALFGVRTTREAVLAYLQEQKRSKRGSEDTTG